MAARLESLGALLPGVPFAQLAWRAPAVLRLCRATLASRLLELRAALPPTVDVAALVARAPALLLLERPGEAVTEGLARLQRALPPTADAAALVALEPGLLLVDVAAGVTAMRSALSLLSDDVFETYLPSPAGLATLLHHSHQAAAAAKAADAGDGDASVAASMQDVP